MQRLNQCVRVALALSVSLAGIMARPAFAAAPCQHDPIVGGEYCLVPGSIHDDPTRPDVKIFQVEVGKRGFQTLADACDGTTRRWIMGKQYSGEVGGNDAWVLLSSGMPIDPIYSKVDATVCNVKPKPKPVLNLPSGFVSFHCALDDCASIQNAWAYEPSTVRDIRIWPNQFVGSIGPDWPKMFRTFQAIVGGQRGTIAVDCSQARYNFLVYPVSIDASGHAEIVGNGGSYQSHTFGGSLFSVACKHA
jgi:hypothetical protein